MLLKESVKKLEVYNMIASFLGVIIMISFSSNTSGSTAYEYSNLQFTIALLANATSTVSLSLVNVILRSLKGLHFIIAAGF